ncbi:MAG: TolC family protein [Bacteroidota bacterium]
MSRLLKITFLILLVLSFKSTAQEILTLEQAIAIALESNYSIRIARNTEKIAENNNTIGNAGMLPSVDADAQYNASITDTRQESRTTGNRELSGVKGSTFGGGVGVDWIVFDGFRMFVAKDRLEELQSIGQLNTLISVEQTIGNVSAAYYDVVRQKQVLKAQREAFKVSVERLRIASAKASVGAGSGLERLQSQVDFNADSSDVLRQKLMLQSAKDLLKQQMGRPDYADFDVVDSIPPPGIASESEIRTLAGQQNLLLKLSEQSKRLSELSIKEANSLWWPQIALSGGYSFNESSNEASIFQFNRSSGWNYGVRASVNLFDGFNTQRQIENAKVEAATRQLQIEEIQAQITTQLNNAYRNFSTSRDILALEQANLDIARRTANIALERFKIGSSTPLELREAQNTFTQAQVRLLTAQYQIKIAELDLLRLSGQIITAGF